MAVDLTRAFEIENGMIADDVVIPSTIFETTRSSKPTFTGDLLTSEEYYNSLTQVDANRVAKIDYTYVSEVLTRQDITYYESDGLTVFDTEVIIFNYTGDDITDIEVT